MKTQFATIALSLAFCLASGTAAAYDGAIISADQNFEGLIASGTAIAYDGAIISADQNFEGSTISAWFTAFFTNSSAY